jgi:hypothetical protein
MLQIQTLTTLGRGSVEGTLSPSEVERKHDHWNFVDSDYANYAMEAQDE